MSGGKERNAAARALRRERWEANFSPWAIAAAGAAISLAFLFQRSLSARAAMFAAFLAAAWLSGKKISIGATIFVSLGIIAANLVVPVGKVLYRLGPLVITEGALTDGIGKALVFEGLIYISKASVLPGLRLPGRFGGLVAASFVYYDRIVEYKGKVRPAKLIEDADALMLELWDEALAAPLGSERAAEIAPEAKPTASPRRRKVAATALATAVALAYAALLVR
jgi:hypothetical protein